MEKESLVIIPTYNEKENIANIIGAVLQLEHPFNVLVVDDNSPDGTAAIVEGLMAEHPGRIDILKRAGKLGLGTAYIAGFKYALEQGYKYIIEMDADFSHPPVKLLELRKACAEQGADVAVGSRYVKGINVEDWPIGRIAMSYGASLYVRLMTGMRVKDSTAGFVCYRSEVLASLNLDNIQFKGYAFQIEMKYLAHCLGYKIVEVPIVFVNRKLGTSKMNTGIFGEALFGVLRLRWQSLFKTEAFRRKLKKYYI